MTLHQVNIVISNFPAANVELSLFSFLVDDKAVKEERERVWDIVCRTAASHVRKQPKLAQIVKRLYLMVRILFTD